MGVERHSSRILIAFFATLIAGVFAWMLILLAIWRVPLTILAKPEQIPEVALTVYSVGLYLWLMILVGIFWRRVAKRPWTDLGIRPSGRQFLRGLLLGSGGLAVIMGLETALGWARFSPPAEWPLPVILLSLGAALAFALSEEILFRGFFLRTLALDHSPRRAILLSAFLYASLHFLRINLAWSDLLLFAMLFGAGIVLALAALHAGSLWVSVGIHASWIAFFSMSQQLGLWQWFETGLPLSGGNTIGLFAIPLFIPLAYLVRRSHV
ncbi:CAAX amino terminal protease self- immunity [compost metagenome]